MRSNTILFLFLSLLYFERGVAVNHVIIAFDEAGTSSWMSSEPEVRENIKFFLFDNNGSPILSQNDYYSVVGFRADVSGENWEDFVYVKRSQESKLEFVKCDSYIKEVFDSPSKWSILSRYHGLLHNESFSLLSIAKPYILSKLGKKENHPLVENTYILLVTDKRYNGADYYNELMYYIDKVGHSKMDIHQIMSVCYDVTEEYCIRYQDSKTWQSIFWIDHYVQKFVVSPNQEYLTLSAVLDYAPSLTAKRIKGGEYEINIDISHSNEHFDVKKLNVDLYSGNTELITLCAFSDFDSHSDTYRFKRDDNVTNLKIHADLLLKDGVYDASLLTHSHINGLIQDVEINIEKDAEFLLAVPLPDFLWLPFIDDQYTAAVVLNIFIIISLIIIILLWLYKTNTYKPTKEEVKISCYE